MAWNLKTKATDVNGVENHIDAAVVGRLKSGDPEAFDQVYDFYRPRLFGFLVRLSRRREVAEDLLQETWLRLATRASTLHDDTRLAAWLFTVARNLFLSYRRNRLLDEERTGELFLMRWPTPERSSPFDAATASELENRMEGALASLPLPYREVLLLAAQGLTTEEAAAVCQLTAAALRKRLSRARFLFEKRLAATAMPRIRRVRRETA